MDSARIESYAPAIIKLLREVVSTHDRQEWTMLLENEYVIQEYFNRIGLEVYINRTDGYAYVQQPELDSDETSIKLPRLTRSVSLTPAQTLMLLLLREKLDDFLNQPQESDELIMTDEEIYHMIEPFMPDRKDQRKLYQQIVTLTNKIVEMGFLKVLSAERKREFVVQRVLKSKVSSEIIAQLKQQIVEHYADESEA
jgi:hypothetical protein